MEKSVWKVRSQPYKVLILGYLNDQKYLGFKNFITYDIETEVSLCCIETQKKYNY